MKISIPSYVEENTRLPSYVSENTRLPSYIEENGQMNEEELRRTLIVNKLEKIKAELNNLDFDFGNYYDETEAILNKINSVLDKHIKENKQ